MPFDQVQLAGPEPSAARTRRSRRTARRSRRPSGCSPCVSSMSASTSAAVDRRPDHQERGDRGPDDLEPGVAVDRLAVAQVVVAAPEVDHATSRIADHQREDVGRDDRQHVVERVDRAGLPSSPPPAATARSARRPRRRAVIASVQSATWTNGLRRCLIGAGARYYAEEPGERAGLRSLMSPSDTLTVDASSRTARGPAPCSRACTCRRRGSPRAWPRSPGGISGVFFSRAVPSTARSCWILPWFSTSNG